MSRVRVDLDGVDGLAIHHQMFIDENWEKLNRIGPQFAILWQQDVKVTYTEIPSHEGELSVTFPSEVFGYFRLDKGHFVPLEDE